MGTERATSTGEVIREHSDRYDDASSRGRAGHDGGRRNRSAGKDEGFANALGWLSLGLGLAGLAAPGAVARLIGVPDDDDSRGTLRMIGAREIVSGIGILSQPRPAGWVWSRVAGDAMDLALLNSARSNPRAEGSRVAAATAAVVGITIADLLCSEQLTRDRGGMGQNGAGMSPSVPRKAPLHVRRTLTINRPADEIYRFWLDFENLPRFMEYLKSVRVTGEGRSRWRVEGPGGMTLEWDAETTDAVPGQRIAWRSLPNADVYNAGSVRFKPAPGGRGTEVTVEIDYTPPGGIVGKTIAKLMGKDPQQMVLEDLRNFKRLMETGELPRSEATFPRAKGSFPRERPAQPPAVSAPARG